MEEIAKQENKTEAKTFYKSLFVIVAPIAIQNFITAAVNSADVIMLGYVSQTAIAAVSLASRVQFLLTMFFTGLSSGVIMLTAQYWGKKDATSIRTIMGIALRISATAGIIFAAVTFFFSKQIMYIFTNDPNLVENGVIYLRTVSVTYFCLSVSQVYQALLKSLEHVKTVTTITFIALGLNILLNATFIFGLFGAPKLGLFGVALATSISRIIELFISILISKRIKEVKLSLSAIFCKNKLLTKDFLKYSLPAIGNEFVWGAAWATYSVILGHMGEEIVAANSVISTIRDLTSVLFFGMAYGGAILLGKQIGSGDLPLAKRNASRLIKSTTLVGLLSAVILFCLKPVLPLIADLSPLAAHYRDSLLFINCVSSLGAAINTVLICGVFRSGGDARYGFIVDSIVMWCVSVPLGFLAAFVFKLPPIWVYILLYLDELEKMPALIIHYKKGTWLKNITR